MQHITDVRELQLHNTAVALGKFDGFHRGHQLLLSQVRDWQEQGRTGVIFTFRFADKGAKHIDSAEEKLYRAGESGLDVLLEYPFTREFAHQSPEEFVQRILVEQLDVKAVAIGTDYRFGKDRAGDADAMRSLGEQYGFEVKVFDKLACRQEEISSSLIRSRLIKGDMEFVTEAIGHGYSVYGEVLHGAGLGHTIGIPTINQRIPEDKLLPPYGVYLARTRIAELICYGIANLGCKPTVSDAHITGLETYLFDYSGDAYGLSAEVELLHYIRPEKKFDSLEKLLGQMKQDIQYASELVSEYDSDLR